GGEGRGFFFQERHDIEIGCDTQVPAAWIGERGFEALALGRDLVGAILRHRPQRPGIACHWCRSRQPPAASTEVEAALSLALTPVTRCEMSGRFPVVTRERPVGVIRYAHCQCLEVRHA